MSDNCLDIGGKVAVITGGAGGVGSAIARQLGGHGAKVAILDVSDDALQVVANELTAMKVDVIKFNVDVGDGHQVKSVMDDIERRFSRIDILVSVAGGGKPTTIAATSSEEWSRALEINLTAPFNCIKSCVGAMRRSGGGAIVTVASLASLTMSMNLGVAYTAAKAGVLGLTRHAAFELARDNIRVNAVLPGPVLTNLVRRHESDEVLSSVPRIVPLGRWIEPKEVANAVMYLSCDMSSGCTGTHIVVDGGLHIGSPSDQDAYFKSRLNDERI